MTHLSGGAVSGIVFGTLLFVFVSASMMLWWRRVHRDLYSKDPNTWGGSWGVKAQRETQARIWKAREEAWARQEAELAASKAQEESNPETWNDIEMQAQRREGGSVSSATAAAAAPDNGRVDEVVRPTTMPSEGVKPVEAAEEQKAEHATETVQK